MIRRNASLSVEMSDGFEGDALAGPKEPSGSGVESDGINRLRMTAVP